MSDDLLTPDAIEARAEALGISLAEVCEKAGIAPSTFYRWKSGTTRPRIDVYERLRDATAAEDAA